MELLDIRKLFVKLSGRLDLMDPDTFADNGADVYLVEGSRFLDRKMTTAHDEDSIFKTVKVGDYVAFFTEARVIKEAWFYYNDVRIQLHELTRERVRELYPKILTGTELGTPTVYAPIRGKKRGGATPANFLTELRLSSEDINGVMFPPTDTAGTLEVIGKFYSLNLVEEGENYWSINHPMLLVWAALYNLEISYRNSEGARDWLAAIMNAIVDIEMDHVEEDSYNLRQMGGRENE
jgi:hypothetical protein